MQCKKCGAEFSDEVKICPVCGEEAQWEESVCDLPETEESIEIALEAEETEIAEEAVEAAAPVAAKPKKKLFMPLWAIICSAVLLVAVIVAGTLWAVDYFKGDEPGNSFISYTGVDSELISIRDRVVATVGDMKLTNAELQVYYYMYIFDFLNENSYYLSFLGLDYTKDLATQACYFDKTISWQQYFLDQCLDVWHQYAVLNMEAEKEGFKLPQEEQEYLDNLRTSMDEQAKKYGYKDGQDMVEKELGVGVTFDAYAKYTAQSFVGMGFYNKFAEDIKLTEEDIAKYYADNLKTFNDNNVYKDEAYLVSVRHILIKPETTKDENGKDVVTEEAWEECRKEAQALLDSFLGGKKVTEEAFAALAKEHTEDPGSKEKGGLYEDFARGKMVAEFEQWSFDTSRKYGDTGLVKTTHGYHIMYFVDKEETFATDVRHILLQPETTKDENGKEVITEEAWEACRKEAQALLNSFLGGKEVTEEAFAALAKEHTEDPGSKNTGGLYENVMRGQMVEEFEDWSFAPGRKYGDTGLVKTTYGYHIMYFVQGESQWHYYADGQLRMEQCQSMMDELLKASPINAERQKMLIGRGKVG